MGIFRRWATAQGLRPSETAYVARTRGRRPLRFSRSGDPAIELAYRTHWISPALSGEDGALAEAKRQCLADEESRRRRHPSGTTDSAAIGLQ